MSGRLFKKRKFGGYYEVHLLDFRQSAAASLACVAMETAWSKGLQLGYFALLGGRGLHAQHPLKNNIFGDDLLQKKGA